MVHPLVFACPACISGWEILLLLGVVFIGGPAFMFVSYIPYQMALAALARGPGQGRPLLLFALAFGGAVLWFIVSWGGLILAFDLLQHGHAAAMFVLFGLVALAAPAFLWSGWWRTRARRLAEKAQAAPAPKTPPLQVWTQDLLVASLCYGTGLTLVAGYFDFDQTWREEFLSCSIYLFVAGSCGLLIALDVCRREVRLQRPLPRAGFLTAIFTLFPVTLPLALLAWWRWRRVYRGS